MPEIAKAYAMSDVKISFVSLVDKAANKRRFLVTKAENGSASFQTYGRIVKAEAETHEVTGIVYEPMVEDTQGNFMTENEIAKAAHWFMKNKGNVDLQHSFEPLEGASVVESYIARCEEEIEGQKIAKGTWVMTMEIEDPEIFEKIEKGELTGFSMGGVGIFSDEDVQLPEEEVTKQERIGILKALAKWLGISNEPAPVAKGAVRDTFDRRFVAENFRNAWWALDGALTNIWNPEKGEWGPETDMSKVEEALQDFVEISRRIFAHSAEPDSIFKCAAGEDMPPIIKAGRKMSAKNIETLRGIHANLGAFLSNFEDTKEEEEEVTKEEMELITKSVTEAVTAAVQKAMAPAAPAADPVPAADPAPAPVAEQITKADIQDMIDAAIRKATGEEDPEQDPEGEPAEPSQEELINKAVANALRPFMESAGLPTNLNNAIPVQKEEEHYMHGLL